MNEKSLMFNNEVLFKSPKKEECLLLLFTAVFILFFSVSSAVSAQETVSWECRVEGSNDGCKKTIKAPSGKKIVGVTAACNLEYGAVSNTELASVPANTIKVVKKSDSRWFKPSGYCYVGNAKISKGKKTIGEINGINQIRVGCYEHDKNGGDCHIKGTMSLKDGGGTTPEDPQTPIKTTFKCGIGNCPSGTHASAFSKHSACGVPSYKNRTACTTNAGLRFTQCGTGTCPNGYKRKSIQYSVRCSLGDTLGDNETTCIRK